MGISSKGTEGKGTNIIMQNTVILFIRILFVTVVNLYTVRVILSTIGDMDYGIFNAVTGLIMVAGVFGSVLEVSIQRFYSFALGQNDKKSLNEIFSHSIHIFIFVSLAVFLLLETAGLYFLYNEMQIPPCKLNAAVWCFHFSIISFICTIMQIPFSAAVFAHEAIGVYSVISTVDCILRLLAAYIVGWFVADSLKIYGFSMMLVAIIVLMLYVVFSYLKYDECHYKHPHNTTLCKELISFSGWTMLGSLAKVGMIQGSTVLLNIFFGAISNTSFAIALQIHNAFNALCNSMVFALRPAMIKAYAQKNYEYLNMLFFISNKLIYYILIAVAVPFIYEMTAILTIWLKYDISDEKVLFAQLIIIYVVCLAMNNPITIIMQASGKIKKYSIYVESVTLMCVPITWLLFRCGVPSYGVFIAMIGTCVMAHIVRLYCMRQYYSYFYIADYVKSFALPAFIITILVVCTACSLHECVENTFLRIVVLSATIPLMTMLLVYIMGISYNERVMVNKYCIRLIKKKQQRI